MIKTRILILASMILLFSGHLCAQDVVDEDDAVTRAMDAFKERNASPDYKVDGWRIMLVATRDRRKMNVAQAKFKRYYRDLESNMIFVEPYYKLLHGAWRSKLEVAKVLRILKSRFPGAFEVRDKVTQAELYQSLMQEYEE